MGGDLGPSMFIRVRGGDRGGRGSGPPHENHKLEEKLVS